MAFAVHSSSFAVRSLLPLISVVQTAADCFPRYNSTQGHLTLHLLSSESVWAMNAFRAFITAVWLECKRHCERMSAMVRDEQPRFPVGEQQFRKTARSSSSARKAARLDQLASLRRLGLLRKLRRLRLFGTRLVIVVTLFTPLASARPFILPAIQSTAGLEIANAGDTNLEQPYAWVTIMCFIMILAGLAWTAWVRSRPSAPTPLWCQHALLVSGLLSLTMSIAWTAILYTVDANQSPRYLALGCWSMFITAFISESYQHLQQSPQYAFMVVPVFILALHLTLFLVNQNIGPEQPQVWDLRRFYENAPLAFTLWAILLCWIYHQWTPDDCSSEGVGENIDLETLPATSGEGGNDGNPGDSSTPAG